MKERAREKTKKIRSHLNKERKKEKELRKGTEPDTLKINLPFSPARH